MQGKTQHVETAKMTGIRHWTIISLSTFHWVNGDSYGLCKFVLVVFLLLLLLLLLLLNSHLPICNLLLHSLSVKCLVQLCNKKMLPLPTGAGVIKHSLAQGLNWSHLLQQM